MNTQTAAVTTANEPHWKELIDAIPTGLVMLDDAGRIVVANRALEDLFGYAEHELLGQPVDMLLPERFAGVRRGRRDGCLQLPQRSAAGTTQELFGRRKDGTEFPLEIGLNPINMGTGVALVASLSDISVRSRLESNFRQVVEASPVGKLMVDDRGTIQLVNRKLCQLFGYEREELIGQDLEVLLPHACRASHAAQRSAFHAQPGTRAMGAGRDLSGLRKDGSQLAVEVGLNPVETEIGMAVVAAVTDISERKKMERHLRKLNAELDEFTSIASHDLRAPLQGIADLVEWSTEDIGAGAGAAALHKLDRIKLRIQRMERLIDDLLDYARAGRERGEYEDIALGALFEDVIALIEVPDQFDIRMRSDIERINAPRTPLETVLRNLINNAIKHHDRAQGCIEVEVTDKGACCVFSVKDDGPGIPAPAHERVFKLFEVLNSNKSEHSGVGLAISKRLVESYGGRMEIRSGEQQRGTVFSFEWPCQGAESASG
jgi:PAS domain S-box-containing protein